MWHIGVDMLGPIYLKHPVRIGYGYCVGKIMIREDNLSTRYYENVYFLRLKLLNIPDFTKEGGREHSAEAYVPAPSVLQ